MAHFITLFFLSIGINFGGNSDYQNVKISPENSINRNAVRTFTPNAQSKVSSKLYFNNTNSRALKNDKILIGSGGWE